MLTKFSGMVGALAFAMLIYCIPLSECPKPALEINIFMPACSKWPLPISITSFKIIPVSMAISERERWQHLYS